MRTVVPTALGLKAATFYLVLLGSFFAARYTNLYFLLITFLTTLGLLNIGWTWRHFKGISAELIETEPQPANTAIPQTVDISLRYAPRFQVQAQVLMGGKILDFASAALLEQEENKIHGELPALPRGIHKIDAAWIQSSYPLGLLRLRRRIKAPAEIVVHPQVAELPAGKTRNEILADFHGDSIAIDGQVQPSTLREFRPGDELRMIHWKATARRGTFIVKEWEGESSRGIELRFDRRCNAAIFEESLSLITALAFLCRESKELFTLHSQGKSSTHGEGQQPWRELLHWLAGTLPLPDNAAPPPTCSPSVLEFPLKKTRSPA